MEVDVSLALGEFTLEQAAKYLEEKVPMDPNTARQEAIAFSTGPGQAITYQIGKLQITKFLAEARMQQGEKFNLRAFHDFVWKNGNVPIALQGISRRAGPMTRSRWIERSDFKDSAPMGYCRPPQADAGGAAATSDQSRCKRREKRVDQRSFLVVTWRPGWRLRTWVRCESFQLSFERITVPLEFTRSSVGLASAPATPKSPSVGPSARARTFRLVPLLGVTINPAIITLSSTSTNPRVLMLPSFDAAP